MLTLIFLIAFPFALYQAWKNVQRAKASTNLPTTTGSIRASGIKKVMFRRRPLVTYTYEVNGTPHTSQRISFAGGYKPKEVDSALARYPAGTAVTVAYDPENPAEATLETGANKQVTAQLRLLVICFILIIAVNILSYYVKGLNRKSVPPRRTYGLLTEGLSLGRA